MTAADGARRLKAIMFTDIKGYSAMMGVDEQRTVKLVLEHREIVRECLKAHDGSEHETIGDAFVVLFDSVVNAVRCGTEIQQRLRERSQLRRVYRSSGGRQLPAHRERIRHVLRAPGVRGDHGDCIVAARDHQATVIGGLQRMWGSPSGLPHIFLLRSNPARIWPV